MITAKDTHIALTAYHQLPGFEGTVDRPGGRYQLGNFAALYPDELAGVDVRWEDDLPVVTRVHITDAECGTVIVPITRHGRVI